LWRRLHSGLVSLPTAALVIDQGDAVDAGMNVDNDSRKYHHGVAHSMSGTLANSLLFPTPLTFNNNTTTTTTTTTQNNNNHHQQQQQTTATTTTTTTTTKPKIYLKYAFHSSVE